MSDDSMVIDGAAITWSPSMVGHCVSLGGADFFHMAGPMTEDRVTLAYRAYQSGIFTGIQRGKAILSNDIRNLLGIRPGS